jgi:nitrogen fixation NifU-like protein
MGAEIYAEEIISHYEHPHNKKKMENPSVTFRDYNPLCGDEITVYIKTDGKVVEEMTFDGEGCAISIGSASMLTDFLKEKTLKEVSRMGPKDVIEMLGIDPGPARLKCATLSLKAVQKALGVYGVIANREL